MKLNPKITQFSVNDEIRLLHLAAEAVYAGMLDEGDFIEMGVFRGGSATWLAMALKQTESTHKLYLLDSWEGLPALHEEDGNAICGEGFFGNTSEEEVQQLLNNLKLGDICQTCKGWFHDTLTAFEGPFALAHIDCDLYEPVKFCLEHLMPRMTPHGVIVIDDYGNEQQRRFPGVEKAVQESIQGTEWVLCELGGEKDQSVKLVRSMC